jgi:hypothetical protein
MDLFTLIGHRSKTQATKDNVSGYVQGGEVTRDPDSSSLSRGRVAVLLVQRLLWFTIAK